MSCFLCKGDMKEALVTHTADVGGSIIIIKNVPASVCSQCGEVWYSGGVTKQLEQIIDDLQNSVTEIVVAHYPEKVA